MAIVTIGGPQKSRWAGQRVKQTFSQSTATAFQSISLDVPVITLGMGTASGLNFYSLASGAIPGQEISILTSGTGEARVLITAGTATGMHVFTEADDFLKAVYEEGKWRILISSATLSTGT